MTAFLRRPSKLDWITFVAVILTVGCSDPATKDDLAGRFEENRERFENLVEMLREDETIRLLMEDDIRSEPPIEERRLAEYRRIMRQAGVRTLIPERDATPFAVSFPFSDSLDEMTLLEIVYVDEIDSFEERLREDAMQDSLEMRQIQRLDENWYIYSRKLYPDTE